MTGCACFDYQPTIEVSSESVHTTLDTSVADPEIEEGGGGQIE